MAGRAVAVRDFAERLGEDELARFPPAETAGAEEQNAAMIEAELRAPRCRAALARAAACSGADAARLETLCRQRFILGYGRRLTQLRELLAIADPTGFELASDLPQALLERLKAEALPGAGRIRIVALWSGLLRAAAAAAGAVRLVALHAAAGSRIVGLLARPRRMAGTAFRYAAWLGADAPEMAGAGPAAFSLPEFLREALDAGDVDEILIQGAPPGAPLPGSIAHCRGRLALRWRPSMRRVLRHLLAQMGLLVGDLARIADWRHRELIAPSTVALPGFRLWFETDPPRAILYANSSIGMEPAAALIGDRYGVATLMAFYSVNFSHIAKPAQASTASDIEPEIRCIIADRLGMWTREMRAAFETAGYPRARLPVTGPVHYGRQSAFVPPSRSAGPSLAGPVRIGIFEVTTTRAARRFMVGYGQTLYHPEFCRRFFGELVEATRAQFGEQFVVVRKLKRTLNRALHAEPVELTSLLPPDRIVTRAPESSLWSVLSEVDLVVCMPFTSVAYMADWCGIPAAYFDPLAAADRSSLAGRAPLLRGRAALADWLRNPEPNAGYDTGLCVAAETLRAACGGSWTEPRLRRHS
jgi:hypothetical protein